MNISEMKSFLKGTSLFDGNQTGKANSSVANLKPNLGKMVSSASIVERSQANVLGINVLNKVIGGKLQGLDPQAPPPAQGKPNQENSLFDFEEVAKNVLSFVEKALHKAKNNGADDDKLAAMMGKARQGVEDGFAQARQELQDMGQMNDELEQGIGKSYDAIQNGLAKLEQSLFGETEPVGGMMAGMVAGASEVSYSLDRSSSLSITTNDGDKVTINFAEAMGYQRSESAAMYAAQDGEGNGVAGASYQMRESSYHAVGFSFSVEGELDEDEKAAIADLVKDVSKLADEFFNGDLDKAFAQASELGYDESELQGFALNMSRVETVSVAAAYQQVAQFEPDGRAGRGEGKGHGPGGPEHKQNLGQLIKPVANYLKDLMNFIEKSREQLQQGTDLQALVDQSVSRYLEYRGESDIPSALERFAEFNQRILGTLEQTEAVEEEATQGVAVGEPNGEPPA